MSDIAMIDGDIVVTDDDLTLTTGIDAIKQHMSQRLRIFYGEWFLNTGIGVPYFQQILKKNFDPQIVDSLLKKEIINTPGVMQLIEFNLDLDRSARELTLSFRAKCDDGVIDFSEVVP